MFLHRLEVEPFVDDFEVFWNWKFATVLLAMFLEELLHLLAGYNSSRSGLKFHKTVQALHQILSKVFLILEFEISIQVVILPKSRLVLELVLG